MTRKSKLGVVCGDIYAAHRFSIIEKLSEDFQISVFALHSPVFSNFRFSSLKMHLFEPLADMPGYMRDLEEHLSDCDLILGFETSSLASFQAQRIATKLKVPFGVFVDEYRPNFYEVYPNIRAVQTDIHMNAAAFFPSSKFASDCLIAEGVDEAKVVSLDPLITLPSETECIALRSKFRKYLNIDAESVLIGYCGPLAPGYRLEELIDGVGRLIKSRPQLANCLNLLVVGEGEYASSLKYRAFDHGIGHRSIFIEQDHSPFATDLYSALDVLVRLEPDHSLLERHDRFPNDFLEAVGCQTVPIVSFGSLEHSLIDEVSGALMASTPECIAQALIPLATNLELLASIKRRQAATMRKRFAGNDSVVDQFRQHLNRVLQTNSSKREHADKQVNVVDMISPVMATDVSSLEPSRDLQRILGEASLTVKQKSEALCLLGDALRSRGDTSSAVDAYSESIKLDGQNFASFRGLGFSALQSHSHDEAMTFFKKVMSIQPDDHEALLGIGLTYRRLNLFNESIQWLERCVIRQPGEKGRALSALVQTCLESNDVGSAIKSLQRVRESFELSTVILALGQLYLKAGRSEQGHELVEEALAMQQQETSAS